MLHPHDPSRWLFRTLGLGPLGLALALGCGGGSTHGPAPVISSFSASPATVSQGQGTFLTFAFANGTGSVDHGIGAVNPGASIPVSASATTTYTLTVQGAAGVTSATTQVRVASFTSRFAYVANSGGGISGFALDDATGALTELGGSPYDQTLPSLHVSADPQGRFLFSVNSDGVVSDDLLSVYRIDPATGDLTPAATVATGANPWCASADPAGKFVYVRSAGAVSSYSLNAATGALTLVASVAASGGTGDLTIHPSGKFLFTAGRDSDALDTFGLNPGTGALNRIGAAYALPAGTGPLGVALNPTGEFLFTKGEGAAGGVPVDCSIYSYRVNFDSGLLTSLGPLVTGLNQSDSYHGVSYNPTREVLYTTFHNAIDDLGAFTFNPGGKTLTALAGSPYSWLGGGSDNLTLTRNGKWALINDYDGNQIATAAVEAATGALTLGSFQGTGLFPVSVTVVGTLQ